MYRRLEYKHDYFGDVEIARQKQPKHYPLVIHAENLSLSLSRNHPVFSWKWEKEVPIFNNLNFEIQFGKIFGVIGTDACKVPGVNKNASTNTSSATETRNGIEFTHSGHVYYNEKYPSKETLSKVDFVSKGNHFYPFVTVRETVLHYARIQYPHLDEDDLAEKVVKIMSDMGLSLCSSNSIGSEDSKIGTTPEDKIRLRIALQMLNNPSVIFLEDPFDGLDDFLCNNLINLFIEISSRGPAVVFSMGANRTQHTNKLHEVLVLNDGGECVYVGHAGDELEKYLTGSGTIVEKGINPLDKLLQVAHEEYNQQSRGLIEQFLRKKPATRSNTASTQKLPPELTEDFDPLDEYETLGLKQQFKPLFTQTLKNTFRNKKVMMLYLVELVVLALTPCVLFWRIVNGEAQPWDTLGFSFYLSSFHPYVLFVVNLYRVIQDIPPLLQEHATAKRPRTFYSIVVARFLFQLLLDLGASLLFYTLVYWDTKSLSGSGTYSSVNFLEFFGVSVLVHLSSVSLAYLSGSLFGRSFVFGTIFSAINFLVTGFLLNTYIFPGYLHWIQYIPYQSYAYELYIIVANNLQPIVYTGNIHDMLLTMPFSGEPIVFRAIVLLLFIVFNHVVAGFLLWRLYKKNHQDMFFEPARRTISGKSATANYNSFFDAKPAISTKVCVGVIQLTAKDNSQEVLRGINGICRSGELLLALGDKESGLKALLDIIGGIYKEGSGKSPEIIGGIHINNYQPHAQFLQKLVGYVHSGEINFGNLSAKETIKYYALLKMSRDSPVSEKYNKADSLLREFGFAEKMYIPACNLNAEFKLRLSIAIQMLNNPLIVIVNDQLKGLDYTSAKDILDLLKKIAQQGRVVICATTYGQGWMMKTADNILMMTQGAVAYFGRSGPSFLRHLRKIGYDVPPFYDALLYSQSLLSVDRTTGGTEVESKNKIRSIVEKWSSSENLDDTQELQKLQFPKIQMLIDTRGYERNFLLFKRMMLQRIKQPYLLALHIFMPLVFSAVVSMVFSNSLTSDLYGIQSRMGIITAFNLYIVFGFLHGFLFFPKENEIFIKDHQANNCTPLGFYLSYFTCELALNFISAVSTALIVMYINHMHVTAETYFCFVFFIILLLSSGQAFSTIITSLVSRTDVSIAIFSVGVAIVISFSSFLSTDSFVVLDYIRYGSVLSDISYVFAIHEFRNLSFSCSGISLLFTQSCPVTGEMVLNAFHMKDTGGEGLLIGLAFISTLAYQIIAFVCFSKLQRPLAKR